MKKNDTTKKMSREISAAVVTHAGSPFDIKTVTLDACRSNEVVVRIVAVGMCHTDLMIRDGGIPIPPLPAILGHEGAGVVEEVGDAVTRVKPGDHVVLSFAFCGHCARCDDNVPTSCQTFTLENLRGSRPDGSHVHSCDGVPLSGSFFGQSSFASHALVDERHLVKVDQDLPLELLAPLGCGLQTGAGTVFNRLRPTPGSSMTVFGAGAVGLAAIMAAKVAGCTPIIAVDRHVSRLELAKSLGATHTVIAGENTVADVKAVLGAGSQHIVEASGVPLAAAAAIQCIASGGSLCLLGAYPAGAEVSVPIDTFMGGTKLIQFVIEGDSVPDVFIPRLIALYRQGQFPIDKLIHYYDFTDINQAAEDSENGRVIKPVLRFAPK